MRRGLYVSAKRNGMTGMSTATVQLRGKTKCRECRAPLHPAQTVYRHPRGGVCCTKGCRDFALKRKARK
jgi:hypothetical protein